MDTNPWLLPKHTLAALESALAESHAWPAEDIPTAELDIPEEDVGLDQPERDEDRLEDRTTMARLFVPGRDKPDPPRLLKVATALVRRWGAPATRMRWLVLRDFYMNGWRVYFVDGSEHPGLIDRAVAESVRGIAAELFWLGVDVRSCLQRSPWMLSGKFRGIPTQQMPVSMNGVTDAKVALWCRFLHYAAEAGTDMTDQEMTASGEDVLAAADTTPDKDERPTILLYAVEAVERLRAEDRYARESKTRMERLFNGMLESGGLRPLALVPEAMRTALEQLAEDFPNFAEVIAVIRNHLVLRTLDGRAAVGFPPLLLGGSPGIGKTLFSRELAKCLDLPFRRIGFESAQNGAALSGSSAFWSNATPGELALQLIGGDAGSVGNPLILLDELDKIHPGLEYNPAAGLYPLLERHTAAHWQDQCLPIDLDASHVCWVGTANQLERIEAPILSRFQVFEVPDLTGAQARVVALRIYGLILAEESFGRHFTADLDAAVLDRLGAVAPRELRKVLIDALGKAACAGRRQLHPDDVAVGRPGRAKQRPFGFCA